MSIIKQGKSIITNGLASISRGIRVSGMRSTITYAYSSKFRDMKCISKQKRILFSTIYHFNMYGSSDYQNTMWDITYPDNRYDDYSEDHTFYGYDSTMDDISMRLYYGGSYE